MAIWQNAGCASAAANFNLAEAIDIHGEIHLAHFLGAMQTVANETEAARLQMLLTEHGPRQLVAASFTGELPYLDFSRDRDPAAAAEAWMRADVSRARNLIQDRLWITALLRITCDHYIFYQRSHRILPDSAGHGRIACRLAEIYSALTSNNAVAQAGKMPTAITPPVFRQRQRWPGETLTAS
ncbi:Siderophore biosynthesis non-ribosomal peptide synthetase modules [Collimonas arenae]|uniref:Siderophore biosynthesis non-ribosomal peptide synthetase modules n=2 Tax=Collimonas arenae TaxID=279058 RepID=A0A0A1FC88_9BURK|nr:Siderophore biosynthesis non-ribosomal peptide synthetase modules [Collimonas arenae]